MTVHETADEHPLGVFVRERLEHLGLSLQEAADRSGGLVSKSTLWRLTTAHYRGGPLAQDTIDGLAVALRVRPAQIMSLLDAEVVPYIPPPIASLLDEDDRRLVDQVIRGLVRKHQG